MAAKTLMLMGTGSDVGKSLLVAGLARAFTNRGLLVAPFKPQNMSNNAAVAADGGEIGRAQALQARAARRAPITAMNPVLLKPEHETGSQIIVRGRRVGSLPAREYWRRRHEFLPDVLTAFDELAADADLVLVEGAGSASEVNLRAGDIANFGFARAREVPVVLVGDIERGGVIASLVGTLAVIDPDDGALIVATLVNKFRGDPELFVAGREFIAARTGRPCFGPVPWFDNAQKLPAEDSLALAPQPRPRPSGDAYRIVVPQLPRIANFDDLDPLRAEPNVSVIMVPPGLPLPQGADLILLPGSKATRGDLAALRAAGWDVDILAHHRAGKPIIGICGGYQMLGRTIADPDGVEGKPGISEGLGLLDVETVLEPVKQLRQVSGTAHGMGAAGVPIHGYHMHMGVTTGPDAAHPFADIEGQPEGALSHGRGGSMGGGVAGTYLHGIFASDEFRGAFLPFIADSSLNYEVGVEAALDGLAAHLAAHLDLDALLALAREPRC